MKAETTSRRAFLALMSAVGVSGLATDRVVGQERMPTRQIPGTSEYLPVIGLGSSKPVSQIAEKGTGPITDVLRALVANGGSVVDTWPRNPGNDAAFGEVIAEADLRDALFVTTKIDQIGKEAGIEQFRQTQRLYQRETLDLVQVFSLTDLGTQWRNLKDWKSTGAARYIGVTVANEELYVPLERFLKREKPDFVQINYSITERGAEDRMLPLFADLGIAVIVNRPFMNGAYFERLGARPVPGWAAEFGCESWAQFSLKYILPHPAVTCVLTETSSARHMEENARAAFGRLPDDAERKRMTVAIDQV
ncbi:MAG: aldo/keto reductase [Proteobacteria bacterium]|nr:aldo/keto reductase [Pseudomonadota bacterium]